MGKIKLRVNFPKTISQAMPEKVCLTQKLWEGQEENSSYSLPIPLMTKFNFVVKS